MPLRALTLPELVIDDEGSFAAVPLYAQLKRVVARSGHRFLIPSEGTQASWDRVLFLNLTFWSGGDGADVLSDEHIPADVITHVAWHHLAAEHLGPPAPASAGADVLLFAESLASAFDLYLVGRLLQAAPDSDFISTQVPIMGEAAQQAGLSEAAFLSLMAEVTREPERAFEDTRTLLLDAGCDLLACRDVAAAQVALENYAGHRFEPLLHHFQLSNWILYARAYAPRSLGGLGAEVREVDAALRQAPDSLEWLANRWLRPGG